MQEKVEFKNRKGQKIVAAITKPENPKGLAFTMHGLSGFKEQPYLVTLTSSLVDNGYIVVNFDATNSFGESEGEYEKVTMQLHYEDLVDVIDFIKTQEWYIEPFLLVGHSLGGYAVVQYAEDHPTEVKAVFSYAAVVAGELFHKEKEVFETEKYKIWKETGWDERKSISRPGLIRRLPWSFMEETLKHDLRSNVSKLTMPVIMVAGDQDKMYLSGNQKSFFDLIPGPKEMHVIKGAAHTFSEPGHIVQLKNIMDKWLKKIN